jgi:hypothetical protein
MMVTAICADPGTSVMASSSSTAPAMKDNKLAPAVWPGWTSCSGSMPSSAWACAASAARAVIDPGQFRHLRLRALGELAAFQRQHCQARSHASALATYVHRVLTCRGDTPTLDL